VQTYITNMPTNCERNITKRYKIFLVGSSFDIFLP